VRSELHWVSDPSATLERRDEEAAIESKVMAVAHSERFGQVVGGEIARQVLMVVVALYVVFVEPFLALRERTCTLSRLSPSPMRAHVRS
jgi:hypothetical protein